MDKNLILTSNQFPVNQTETFLVNEYPYLRSAFKKISIHPYRSNYKVNSMQGFDILTLEETHVDIKSLIKENWYLLLHSWLFEIFKSGKPFYYIKNVTRYFNIWMGWLQEAKKWERTLQNFDPKDTVIYSYWYENQAIPLTILRAQKKLPFKWISRAHGWDVDKRQREDRIIPFRHWMLQC
jgi:hypothetical protein